MRAIAPTLLALGLCLAASLPAATIEAQDIARIEGRWRLNRTKSFSPPGSASVGPETRSYEDLGEGMVRAEVRRGELRTSYRARHDGERYRMTMTGTSGVWTIEFTPVDTYTSTWLIRQNGRVVQQGRSTVSEDGQTYTEAILGGAVRVYDRR